MIRIVKMTIQKDKLEQFKSIFNQSKSVIMTFKGVQKVCLLQDKNDKRIVMTYSVWNTEDDLNYYRNSPSFLKIWKSVKPLFAEKAQAYSLDNI